MKGPVWSALASLLAWFIHWSAHVLPMCHAGPICIPGFAALVVVAALAALAGVVWFMILGPHRRDERARLAAWAFT